MGSTQKLRRTTTAKIKFASKDRKRSTVIGTQSCCMDFDKPGRPSATSLSSGTTRHSRGSINRGCFGNAEDAFCKASYSGSELLPSGSGCGLGSEIFQTASSCSRDDVGVLLKIKSGDSLISPVPSLEGN